MKRILGILVLSALISFAYGQRSIDALFEKYSGSEGFVTLTISGNLLNLFKSCDKDKSEDHWPAKVTEIRILAQDDEDMKTENFYDKVMNDINLRDYEEFMRVKESDQDLRMLVRTDGDVIKEFLLVAGGEDNVIIQVKGKMTFQEAEEFSSRAKKDHRIKELSDLN
jgi:hypothetical protein